MTASGGFVQKKKISIIIVKILDENNNYILLSRGETNKLVNDDIFRNRCRWCNYQ